MINKFQKGGKQQDAVMQFVKGLADTLQADPNEVIQLAQKHPDALESAVQVYQQTEGDIKKAAQAFAQTIQKKTKKALHGAKLQYFKNLKNQCADDEELYYYKKGGSLGCGCKKKEIGGEVRKAGLGCSAVDKFKLTRKAQSGIKNYTKDQIAGREPVKVVNGVKYYLNGDGEIVKDPKGKNSAKPDNGSWQTYDEKTGKMRPATPAEIAQRKKNNRDGYKGKGEGTPQRKKGGNLKKDCGGSTVIAKFKAKCGAKVKKHEQGGSLNRIPFYQAGTPEGGIEKTSSIPNRPKFILPTKVKPVNWQGSVSAKSGVFDTAKDGTQTYFESFGKRSKLGDRFNRHIQTYYFPEGIKSDTTYQYFPKYGQPKVAFSKVKEDSTDYKQLKEQFNKIVSKPLDIHYFDL